MMRLLRLLASDKPIRDGSKYLDGVTRQTREE